MPCNQFFSLINEILLFSQAYDEYEIVANSYRYSYLYSKQIYFTLADFDEASDVFNAVSFFLLLMGTILSAFSFQLSINSAPVIIHFPAKGTRKKADTMDISRYVKRLWFFRYAI